MQVIGIDPGKSGAIACISAGEPDWVEVMPMAGKEIDWHAVGSLVSGATHAFIEKVHAMPRQGVSSTFTFGASYGGLLGACGALSIPVRTVTPQAWKKKILAGTAKDKDAAVAYCRRRWPSVSLLPTPRCRKLHDGMADALCLAAYGWEELR